MKHSITIYAILLIATILSLANTAADSESVAIQSPDYAVSFDADTASIQQLTPAGGERPILQSGEFGLWRAEFADGTSVHADQFTPDGDRGRRLKIERTGDRLRLRFTGPLIRVNLKVIAAPDHLDLRASVTPLDRTLLRFSVPAQLRFQPDHLRRLIFPYGGNHSVGAAFNDNFFKRQPADEPSGWRREPCGPRGYTTLFDEPLDQRADNDRPVPLTVTDTGRRWLGSSLAERIEGTRATVNRPSLPKQVDTVLVDSENGPYFSGSDLSGTGHLWRIGGKVGDACRHIVARMVVRAITQLAADAPDTRNKVGLVALEHGPSSGGWTTVDVDEWRSRITASGAVVTEGCELVELKTPRRMIEAADGDEFMAILNPYGEWIPVTEDGGMKATLQAVEGFVKGGGNWFEVGGYPFYYELRPKRYLKAQFGYPPAFADFLHLDGTDGASASIYRVQKQGGGPWEGAEDTQKIFVPGRLACGGDENGGWLRRPFVTHVKAGDTWSAPTVRITSGQSAPDALRQYCRVNGITRGLKDKMDRETLRKFKRSVLVKYNGNCADSIEYMDLLPQPTLIHFAGYLRGGFDEQYPDHLPPHPGYGNSDQFHRFSQKAHNQGHLMMPYTNPTWWCTDPKGPTFKREGTDPLLRKLNGKLSREVYGDRTHPGYSICQWHPAVRNANEKTRRQFTRQYPVDILFQDQCGARGFKYDTNPASPTAYAYTEGIIARVAEDSEYVPLSTEGGWDRVVNHEAQLCGMSFSLVPTEHGPSWRELLKHEYPPRTWNIFPVAQYIAHDKCALIYHDLGAFVTSRRIVSWTLGLGFNMSYSVAARSLSRDAVRQWLLWLDRLQKSICSRYTGKPVISFQHNRPGEPSMTRDGVIRAQYGDVTIIANLNSNPARIAGHHLAGYGFYARAPGMVAGNLKSVADMQYGDDGVNFVVDEENGGRKAYVFARERRNVKVPTPGGEVVSVSTPRWPGRKRISPPQKLAKKPPQNWSGEPPAVGIIDLGSKTHPHWTDIKVQDWTDAFADSNLCKEGGVPIKRLTTVDRLTGALQDGPRKYFAIVNPYGELFPAPRVDNWQKMLDMIREYVQNGGVWWETAGYSFHSVGAPDHDGGWTEKSVGPAGMAHLGLPVGSGDVQAPAEPLGVTDFGRQVLGEKLADKIAGGRSPVNRGLPVGPADPGHRTIVKGKSGDFIGGYRLNGWGWLYRIGGFNPNPELAVPVVVQTTDYLYSHPPLPVRPRQTKRLWALELQ